MKDDLQLGKLKENCLLLKLLKRLTGDQKVAGSIPVRGSEIFF